MSPSFFDRPILNSPYDYPARHSELDPTGQPTDRIIERRRLAQYVSPIPQPKKRRAEQAELNLADASGLSTERQKYDPTPVINALRQSVDAWRALPNPNDWAVTPETARLLAHRRRHKFENLRPFFCQIEAVETIIWLVEVAPKLGARRPGGNGPWKL
jgi:type III restriction enzyme